MRVYQAGGKSHAAKKTNVPPATQIVGAASRDVDEFAWGYILKFHQKQYGLAFVKWSILLAEQLRRFNFETILGEVRGTLTRLHEV